MQKTIVAIHITAEDLVGIDLDECTCRGCNGQMCGEKTPKLYNGNLVFICHVSDAGRKLLARVTARS